MRAALLLAAAFLLWSVACGPRRLGGYGPVEWEDPHGILVVPAGHPVDRAELAAEVERVLGLWEIAIPGSRDACRGTFLVFEPLPFVGPVAFCGAKGCAGLYEPSLRAARVGFREPLSSTALGHEIGHAILHRVGRPYDEESLRAFAREHGLPY